MVNSGSSANLLAATASCNPLRKKRFKRGDEVLLPGICWSTSLWPLIINGLKPIFVDVDVNSLNVNVDDLKKDYQKTKVICCVHVLGNSSNMLQIKKIAKENNLIIIEDTCESLGSSFAKKKLGTFGDFGTYSFIILIKYLQEREVWWFVIQKKTMRFFFLFELMVGLEMEINTNIIKKIF